MNVNVRGVKYNQHGTINCEIEHPVYGWIPFTASPDDPEEHGRELYARAIAGDFGPIAEYVPPSAEEVLQMQRQFASMSARDFKRALLDAGYLSAIKEALPTLPEAWQIDWETAQSFDRMNPDLIEAATQLGFTEEQLDQLFGIEINP